MTTILLGALVLLAAALLAYVADRGLPNTLERIAIACLRAASRMRARRDAVAEQQALMLMALQRGE